MADIPEGKNPETWRPYRAPGEPYKGPRREFDSVPLGDLLGRGGHGGQKRAYKRRERVRAIPECEAAVRWEAARIKMYLRAKSRMLAQDQPERWRMGCGPLTEERHEVLCFLLDRIGANRKVCISHGCVADGTDRGVNTVKRAIAVGEMLLEGVVDRGR